MSKLPFAWLKTRIDAFLGKLQAKNCTIEGHTKLIQNQICFFFQADIAKQLALCRSIKMAILDDEEPLVSLPNLLVRQCTREIFE